MLKTYEIWCEGYVASGGSSGATLLGHSEGETFQEACDNYELIDNEFKKYYNSERMTFWGCRLFDNQSAAMKSFG